MSAAGMNRLYNDRSFVTRNWVSVAVLVAAVVWGGVEILRAQSGASDQTGFMFGIGFLAAAAYGLYRMMNDARDQIVRLEADPASGHAMVALWRPWGMQRLETSLDRLTNWRMYVAIKRRNQPTFLLMVDHPDRPRPLHIELTPGMAGLDGLRQVAPGPVAEFEQRTTRPSG